MLLLRRTPTTRACSWSQAHRRQEKALFAGTLFRMYNRYAERRGWKAEMISANETNIGGLEVVFMLERALQQAEIRVVSTGYSEFHPNPGADTHLRRNGGGTAGGQEVDIEISPTTFGLTCSGRRATAGRA